MVDTAALEVFHDVVCPITAAGTLLQELQLPVKLGGMGMRRVTSTAPLAFAAACAAARADRGLVIPAESRIASTYLDPLLDSGTPGADSAVTRYHPELAEEVAEFARTGEHRKGMQKEPET